MGKKNIRQKFDPSPLLYIFLVKTGTWQQNPRNVKMHHAEEKSNGLLCNKTFEDLLFTFALKFSLMPMVMLWIGVLHRSGTDMIRVFFLELQNCRIIYIERNYRQSSSWSPCSCRANIKITSSCWVSRSTECSISPSVEMPQPPWAPVPGYSLFLFFIALLTKSS